CSSTPGCWPWPRTAAPWNSCCGARAGTSSRPMLSTPSPVSSTSATSNPCGVSGLFGWPRTRVTAAGSRRTGCSPRSKRSPALRPEPRMRPCRWRARLRDREAGAMSGTVGSELPRSVAPPPPGARDLDHSLVRGIAWTGVMRWATQLLSWASTLIVARLLAPTDYGLVGMALVYLGFIELVSEFGLGAAIITRRDLTEDQIARLAGLALLIGGGLIGLSAVLAAPVAAFFGEPPVRWIIMVSSLTFLTGALQVVPRALLTRDLDFRRIAWADGAEALLGTCTALTLAALGLRYWALVLGPVVGRTTSTVLVNGWRSHRMAWPRRFGSIAGAVNFGWHVVVARLAWYWYSNADFAVVGRVLGKAPLGAYTLGWTISSIPIERVTSLVGSVTPPVFSAVQRDPPALQRYLRNLTEGL